MMYSALHVKGRVVEKITIFKELTPRSQAYELHNQEGKKNLSKSRQTNTSHCPRKTISKNVHHSLNEITPRNETYQQCYLVFNQEIC